MAVVLLLRYAMKYTPEQLEAIAAKLKAMPPAEKRNQEYSKQEAVRLLSKQIVALQKRGYTLEQIAEILREEGLDLSGSTLRIYLQRAKPNKKRDTLPLHTDEHRDTPPPPNVKKVDTPPLHTDERNHTPPAATVKKTDTPPLHTDERNHTTPAATVKKADTPPPTPAATVKKGGLSNLDEQRLHFSDSSFTKLSDTDDI